jgi:hypothetical protein
MSAAHSNAAGLPGPAGIIWVVIIRQATEQDWPLIYPIYAAIDHPEHGLVSLHIMFRHR